MENKVKKPYPQPFPLTGQGRKKPTLAILSKEISIIGIVFLTIIFFGLRLWKLDEKINFSMDQGVSMIRAYEIWNKKEITLIGPEASPIVEGRHFFHGPATYYLLVVLGILTNWEPIRISVLLVLLSGLSTIILFKCAKETFDIATAWISVFIWTFLPFAIDFSHLIWNPNFLLLLTPVIIYTYAKQWFLVLGIMLGIGLQFHFQAILLIILGLILMAVKKVKLTSYIKLFLGGIVGYLPLLVFDFRNNFYNIRTIFKWITSDTASQTSTPVFYFVALLPIAIILAAKMLSKNKIIAGIIIALLGITSIIGVLTETQAKGMPNGWNFQKLVKAENIILKETPNNFNIVNLLSGDTKFYPLRYLLIKDKREPNKIDNYSDLDKLYVVAYDNEDVLKNKTWELKDIAKMKISNHWPLGHLIVMYELKRL